MGMSDYATVHFYFDEDENGDIVDCAVFCSDHCHKSWCEENGHTYGGWNGAYETDQRVSCSNCGETC